MFLGCSYLFNRSKANANNFITAYDYSILVRFAIHNPGYLEPWRTSLDYLIHVGTWFKRRTSMTSHGWWMSHLKCLGIPTSWAYNNKTKKLMVLIIILVINNCNNKKYIFTFVLMPLIPPIQFSKWSFVKNCRVTELELSNLNTADSSTYYYSMGAGLEIQTMLVYSEFNKWL